MIEFADSNGDVTARAVTPSVTQPGCVTPGGELLLSLFPGVDLLGRAFRSEGFCVVTGPDVLWGDDIRQFRGRRGKFDGIIGGSPCQEFSAARRGSPVYDGYGVEMLIEYLRVVSECGPDWFLLENVPAVPDVQLEGYRVQRLDLTDAECGGEQLRLRHIQFGSRSGEIIRPERLPLVTRRLNGGGGFKPAVTGSTEAMSYSEACRRQGLVTPLRLPGLSRKAKQQAVGNGVSLNVGRVLARAVTHRSPPGDRDCTCGCGRRLRGNQTQATPACRKRMERRRRTPKPVVTPDGILP